LMKEQRFADAIQYYKNAVQIDPASDAGWYNLGVAYARTRQNDSSIFAMKKAIAVNPEYDGYKAFGNVAILYEMAGNMDSARRYEQLTQQHFPDFHLKH